MSTYYWLRKPIALKHVVGERWRYHENKDGEPFLTNGSKNFIAISFLPEGKKDDERRIEGFTRYGGNHVGSLPDALDAKSEHQMTDADYKLAARRWRRAEKKAAGSK